MLFTTDRSKAVVLKVFVLMRFCNSFIFLWLFGAGDFVILVWWILSGTAIISLGTRQLVALLALHYEKKGK